MTQKSADFSSNASNNAQQELLDANTRNENVLSVIDELSNFNVSLKEAIQLEVSNQQGVPDSHIHSQSVDQLSHANLEKNNQIS